MIDAASMMKAKERLSISSESAAALQAAAAKVGQAFVLDGAQARDKASRTRTSAAWPSGRSEAYLPEFVK